MTTSAGGKHVSDVESGQGSNGGGEEKPLDPQTERALAFVSMLLEKMEMDAEVTLAPAAATSPPLASARQVWTARLAS